MEKSENGGRVPVKAILAIIFGLFYVFGPIDFIPDFIPVLGQLDDLGVAATCIGIACSDVKKCRKK